MNASKDGLKNLNNSNLSRRDWILLPALGLLTILLLAVSAEVVARRVLPTGEDKLTNCFISGGNGDGTHGIPNTVCTEKAAESEFVATYRFNSCGHRANMECGPKPTGTYRIVMVGSSMAMGALVPIEMTIGALLPEELSRQTGRKIDLYNEATRASNPMRNIALHFEEVRVADPNVVLWLVNAVDVKNAQTAFPHLGEEGTAGKKVPPPERASGLLERRLFKIKAAFASGSFADGLITLFGETRTVLTLRHFMYESEGADQYVNSFLMNEDNSGFLRTQPREEWQRRLSYFDRYVAEIARRARIAETPVVIVLVPTRAQAAMISMDKWPAGYDPYKLDDELRAIVTSHGLTYISMLPDFRAIPNPQQYFLPLDGHPSSAGHALIAGLVAKELTSGVIPALKVDSDPQVAVQAGK